MHLVLIDGSGYLFRAFHALPPMTRPDGTPVNAAFGFTNMLAQFLKDHTGTHIAVIFDAGRHTFRNRLYDAYKAHRPEPPPELIPQFALVREATEALGVPAIELADWEADDLLAAYALAAERAGGRATIVSSDKDLMQLIRPAVAMMDPLKRRPIGAAEVMEKFGVAPDKVVEVQALIGDSSDNVPGVPGIGPKGAAALINEFGTLDAVLAAAPAMKPSKRRDSLIEHAAKARLSRELVTLRDDAPLPLPLEALVAREPDAPALVAWLTAQGFRSTIARLGLEAGAAPPRVSASFPAAAPPHAFAPSTPRPAETPAADVPFGPYETVSTLDALRVWVEAARAAGRVALDTETDGLDALRAHLIGLSLATAEGKACYVPLRHETATAPPPKGGDGSAGPLFAGSLFADPVEPSSGDGDGDGPEPSPADPDVAAGQPSPDGAAGGTGSLFADLAPPVGSPTPNKVAKGPGPLFAAPAVAVGQPSPDAPAGEPPTAAPAVAVEQPDLAGVIEILGPLLSDPTVLKVLQNAKFDLMILGRAGFPPIAPIDDTMLISYAQDAGRNGHGMDELSKLHLGHAPIPYNEVTGTGRNRISFARVPIDKATAYAAEDADVTLRLWDRLKPRLRQNRALALYEQVERRLVPVLLDMERQGIKVDSDELKRMSVDFERRMAVMETECHRLAGRTFNIGSPKQLGEVLFDEMNLSGGKRMKTGAWGTDSAVLQNLADQGHDLPARILEWRQLAKLKSTYADALVEEINPETGRVHTSYAQAIAVTGRLSSTDPNLQNIPIRTEEGGRIRRAFIAEPGHVLISADYSQIELRLMAHVADIPALKESFARGEDIHARTASEVFGVPMAEMDGATRRRAKAINFGIIYGISGFGLARQLGIGQGEAAVYIKRYFERYPAIREYMEHAKATAREKGYVTTPFGRRCWIAGIADRMPGRRAGAERQAINAPLQGGAADIIKRAMIHLPPVLAREAPTARMLLQVHDELLFEVPADDAAHLAAVAKRVMEAAATISVPLVVETGIGRSWAEAH